jgi:hypothetical protein
MKNKITKRSYTFVERPLSEFYSVRIKEGIFAGNIITYGKVSIKETEGEKVVLQFTYRIEEAVPPYTVKELEDSSDFKTLLGDILTHILADFVESGEYRIGSAKKSKNVNKPTDDDPVETDS